MKEKRGSIMLRGASFNAVAGIFIFIGGNLVSLVMLSLTRMAVGPVNTPQAIAVMDHWTALGNTIMVAGFVIGLLCMVPNYFRVDGASGTVQIYWLGVIPQKLAAREGISAVELSGLSGSAYKSMPALKFKTIGLRLADGASKPLTRIVDPIQAEALAREVAELLGVSLQGVDEQTREELADSGAGLPFYLHQSAAPAQALPPEVLPANDRLEEEARPEGILFTVKPGSSPLAQALGQTGSDSRGSRVTWLGCGGFVFTGIALVIAASFGVTNPGKTLLGLLASPTFLFFTLGAVLMLFFLVKSLLADRSIKILVSMDKLVISVRGSAPLALPLEAIKEMEPVFDNLTGSRYSTQVRAWGYLALKVGEHVHHLEDLEYATVLDLDKRIKQAVRKLLGLAEPGEGEAGANQPS